MTTCGCQPCGREFTSLAAFDRHQDIDYGRRPVIICRDPATLGLERNAAGRWHFPATDRSRAMLANLRAKRPATLVPGTPRDPGAAESLSARRDLSVGEVTALCIHDLPPGTCSDCTGRGQEPEPEHGDAGPAFTARYPGKCSGCGDPFSEGDRIRADGTGHGYLHQECAP